MGRGNDLILAAFRGKFLVNYELTIDSNNNNRLNVDLRMIQKDSKNPENNHDVIASIPEDKVLAKLSQIKPFGVNVPKDVDLNFVRRLPTKPRLDYLNDRVGIKTVRESDTAFQKHLDDENTQIFLGKFGAKYETEDSDADKLGVYQRFYAFNPKTRNMMFFREEETGIPYKLHLYMRLAKDKAAQLKKNHELFN